jgi:hypothetical protein
MTLPIYHMTSKNIYQSNFVNMTEILFLDFEILKLD